MYTFVITVFFITRFLFLLYMKLSSTRNAELRILESLSSFLNEILFRLLFLNYNKNSNSENILFNYKLHIN